MDGMMSQAMGQQAFYFYNHNHDHKMARQAIFAQQMAAYQMVPTLPPTPMYSRPNSSCSQPPTLYSNGPSVMTPTSTPPLSRKHMMLDAEFGDNPYFPSTPPLSTSGSTVGSPKACDMLQTPMNPMFSGLEGIAMKEAVDTTESLVVDWASIVSPPLSPVYFQSQVSRVPSPTSSPSDILSTASCPSLSPSPTPYARSVTSEHDVDFCDPRNLTVSVGSNPTLAPEFTLTGLAEDLKGEQLSTAQHTFDFNPALPSGLPTFEDFSDLESEADFSNLVNLGEVNPIDISRPRACTGSSVVSLGHGSFIGDEELSFEDNDAFGFNSLPSPTSSIDFSDVHQDKRRKKEKKDIKPIMNTAASGSPSGNEQIGATPAASAASDSNASSASEDPSSMPAPTNRRGRKQSLTEDPSKTFVCDLCNRRFRRQEHLKRHYRSLHTQEKPFECNECGKKFSRSDNLAQHARTHAGGAIVMNLIEDGSEVPAFDGSMMTGPVGDDYNTYGKVLFQIASEIPGSASELSSEEGDQSKKKRKRSD
ncbi:uncharacterized protein TrAtP1_004178 [Trichoderma atroviride]|uniref:C2H2-type transcription factor MSN2 n=2 Tax=Hypocrea atroviridis TaxID=63577 RepID=G9P7R6_HYPAI|nr:uncharacterized protein TRIATDRAFT_135877 [Trichoderma atroviride IMI 206040]AAM73769.1 stress response element binding protein [Trichoderma atroviride]EHK40819.1 hypothetical protein TRIATDRAFT_135877 [Trichoderma atroviride IMI 206040]UKZ62948.1 hypothetical protein TrAtP1_004178 [Trichoderma atroviride]